MNQHYILPIYNVLLKRGKRWCKCNCQLNSGSQRLYFSSDILESLKCDLLAGTGVEYAISTHMVTQQKHLGGEIGFGCDETPPCVNWLSIWYETRVLKLRSGYWESKVSQLHSCCWCWKWFMCCEPSGFVRCWPNPVYQNSWIWSSVFMVLNGKLPRVLSPLETAFIFCILIRLS